MNETHFANLLGQTITWVTSRVDAANPRWSMRSPELRPPDNGESDNPGFLNRPEYIQHVVATRARLLAQLDSAGQFPRPPGRLLLVDYDNTNYNEATEIESNGFFDWADNPPWDLWVCEIGDKLVAWIPNEFISSVNRSIEVECMGMLEWVPDNCGQLGYPPWLARYKTESEHMKD